MSVRTCRTDPHDEEKTCRLDPHLEFGQAEMDLDTERDAPALLALTLMALEITVNVDGSGHMKHAVVEKSTRGRTLIVS